MRTLKDMAEGQIKQANDMIAKHQLEINNARKNLNLEKLDEEYFNNKAIIAIKQEDINYWTGIKVMAEIVLNYTSNYIDQEEISYEEMMDSVPTTI